MQSKSNDRMLVAMRIFITLFLILVLVACEGQVDRQPLAKEGDRNEVIYNSEACLPPASDPEQVTISDLISRPEMFEGKSVMLSGYYYSKFEHSAIYANERDPYVSSFDDGLWLYGLSPFSKISGQHVVVSGIFAQKKKGHLEQWPGSVCASFVAPFGSGP